MVTWCLTCKTGRKFKPKIKEFQYTEPTSFRNYYEVWACVVCEEETSSVKHWPHKSNTICGLPGDLGITPDRYHSRRFTNLPSEINCEDCAMMLIEVTLIPQPDWRPEFGIPEDLYAL